MKQMDEQAHSSTKPETVSKLVVVKTDDDINLINNETEEITMKNGICNDESVVEWSFCKYWQLREVVIGNECFPFVKDLIVEKMHHLEKLEIGQNCFCKVSGGAFVIRDCEELRSVIINGGSFVGVTSVVFESERMLLMVIE